MQYSMLTSSVAHSANNTDPKLLNPFDVVWDGCALWVTARMSSEVIQYTPHGKRMSAVNVPMPTGICAGTEKGCKKRTQSVYVASAGGNVYMLGDVASSSTMMPKIHVSPGGMLGGVAWHKHKLYVAVYDAGYVAVYNGTTMELTLKDDALMAIGYKPYGVRCIGKKIYITYTNLSMRQGAGYVNVYAAGCKGGLHRVISRANLSMPYGVFASDGDDSSISVANAGTGYISTFSSEYCYMYNERNTYEGDIVLDGIMGTAQVDRKTYFVTSSDGGRVGALGVLRRAGHK